MNLEIYEKAVSEMNDWNLSNEIQRLCQHDSIVFEYSGFFEKREVCSRELAKRWARTKGKIDYDEKMHNLYLDACSLIKEGNLDVVVVLADFLDTIQKCFGRFKK